jgi:hypothetical protein
LTLSRAQKAGDVVVLVCAFAVVAGAASATLTGRAFGHTSRLKGTRIWYAHGTVGAPRTLAARVAPVPAQPVKVQWSVVCQKTNPADPADHLGTAVSAGQVAVDGASVVKLRLPYAKPQMCVATVYATLAKAGALTLQLMAA